MRKKAPLRRLILGTLAAAMIGGPIVGSGCAADFLPISQVDGLRILAVEPEDDGAYAQPGDTVKLRMTWADSRPNAKQPKIVWFAGCYNPDGDQYYGCYEQLANQLSSFTTNPDPLIASGLVGYGDSFSLKLPENLIESRPKPKDGAPWYGVAFVFYLACNGELGFVKPEGTSAASYFPIGCYDRPATDPDAQRLGADNFVPGYTQVYAFADGRTNINPIVTDMTAGGKPITGGPDNSPEVEACPISINDRLAPPGCGRPDPVKDCKTYDVAVVVPKDVAEVDPSGSAPEGGKLYETVWVDYFTDRGSFDTDARLVSDAVEGIRDDLSVGFIPPPEPGPVRIWAVVHDNRGGQSVIERYLRVK